MRFLHTDETLFVFVVFHHGWGKLLRRKNSIAHDAEDTTNRIIITTSAQLIFPALARSFCFSVLPGSIEIMDRWGRAINRTTIGPMEEGDDVILSCRVVGGE